MAMSFSMYSARIDAKFIRQRLCDLVKLLFCWNNWVLDVRIPPEILIIYLIKGLRGKNSLLFQSQKGGRRGFLTNRQALVSK